MDATTSRPEDWIKDPPNAEPGRTVGRLRLFNVDDLLSLPPRGYLLKGMLAPAEMSLFVGPPKCGKSFLALHMAYAIAQGRSVFGKRVHQAPVLYVAAEGERGIAKRVVALQRQYGPCAAFHLIAQPADLLHCDAGSGDLHDLILAARLVGAGLVFLDTLSRLLAGGDENGPADMGMFIANVSELRYETGAHVAVVHHGNQASDGKKPRGHTSLIGAADLILEIVKTEDGSRTATVAACKDDADGATAPFRLRLIELGQDDDGDPTTTLLVEELERAPAGSPRLRPMATRARWMLADGIAAHGSLLPMTGEFPAGLHGCREDWWHEECETRRLSAASEKRDRKKAFQKAYQELLEAREVAARDGWVWLPRLREGQA